MSRLHFSNHSTTTTTIAPYTTASWEGSPPQNSKCLPGTPFGWEKGSCRLRWRAGRSKQERVTARCSIAHCRGSHSTRQLVGLVLHLENPRMWAQGKVMLLTEESLIGTRNWFCQPERRNLRASLRWRRVRTAGPLPRDHPQPLTDLSSLTEKRIFTS